MVDRHTNTHTETKSKYFHRELFNFRQEFSFSFPLFCVIRTSALSFPCGQFCSFTLENFYIDNLIYLIL